MDNNFKADRIVKKHKMELCADAGTVFPLLCPVKEMDWIDGWKENCDFIYTESGIAEEGCVFTVSNPEGGKEVFICSKYDPENTTIEYIKQINGQVIVKWKMEVKDTSDNKSSIFSTYIATSLNEKGNEFIKKHMDDIFPALMKFIEENINYYVLNGKMKKI